MPKKTKLRVWTIFSPGDERLLRTPGESVALADISGQTVQRLLDDMLVTMKQAQGIGLAAPQIGQSLRIAVIAREVDPALPGPLILINPIITQPSSDQVPIEEGCLSIPGVFGIIRRAEGITVRYFDRFGQVHNMTTAGLLARVIQHEVDHLHGVLFIDRQPEFTRGQELLP